MKYTSIALSFLFSFFSFSFLNAQTIIQWDWQNQTDVHYSDIKFKNNFIYAAGYFTASSITIGSNTYTNAGGSDILICKMDTLGNVVWSQHLGSANNESLLNICVDLNDNVLVVGKMSGTLNAGSFTLTSNGGSDMLMIKCSSSGNIVLAKNFGTSGDDEGNDITTDYNNDIYVVGNKDLSNLLFANTNNTYGNAILKLSSNGNELYMHCFRGGLTGQDAIGTAQHIVYSPYDSTLLITGRLFSGLSPFINYAICHSSNLSLITEVTASNSWGIFNGSVLCKTKVNGDVLQISSQGDGSYSYIHDIECNPLNGNCYFAERAHYPLSQNDYNYWLKTESNLNNLSYLSVPISINYMFMGSVSNSGAPLKINYSNNHLYGLLYQQNLYEFITCSDYYAVKLDLSTNNSELRNLDYGETFTSSVGFNGTFCIGNTHAIGKSCSANCAVPNFSLSPAPDVTLCSGSSSSIGLPECFYVKGGTAPFTYSWSPATGLSSTTVPQPNVFGLTSTTTYTLMVADAQMNIAYDTVTVTVNPLPVVSYSVNPSAAVCPGDTVMITYSGAQNYHLNPWTNNQYINNPQMLIVQADTTFEVNGILNGCNSWIRPQVLTFKTLATSDKLLFCDQDSVNLQSSPGSSFIWQPGNLSGANIWVHPQTNTTYTVTATHASGCTATSSVSVYNASILNVTASPSSVCLGGTISLSASGNGYAIGSATAPTAYCIPTTYGTSNGYIALSGFQLGQLNNYDNNYTTDYTNYINLSVPILIAGSTYQAHLIKSTMYSSNVGIWIDYNQDGDFDDTNEFLGQTVLPSGSLTHAVPISINAAAPAGTTKLRVLVVNNSSIQANNTCSYAGYGEYEDYIVRIAKQQPLTTFNWTGGTSPTQGSAVSALPITIGQYMFTANTTDFIGCLASDSVLVNVQDADTTIENVEVCFDQLPFVWNGQSLTTSGNYSYQTLNSFGCDSLVNLTLVVNPLPQPMVNWTGTSLTTQSYYSSYQWLLNGVILAGAIDSFYNPTAVGDYSVQVTDSNGCSNTSSAYNFIPVGVYDVTQDGFTVYPNPTQSLLHIHLQDKKSYTLVLTDMSGKKIFEKKTDGLSKTEHLDLSHLANGVYTLILSDEHRHQVKKITKY